MNFKSLIPVIILSLNVGCTSIQDLERDISSLKYDVASLQAQISEAEKARTPLHREIAALNLRMDETLTEFQGLRGSLDETNFLVNQELETLKHRLTALESSEIAPKPSAAVPPTATPPPPKPTAGLDPEEIYAQAYRIFKDGNLSSAREAFRDFLRRFPDTEYSDNAQFWIGECYFKEKNYEEAILAYEDVVSKYPQGNKVPDALLKQGLCFQELGDDVSARIILQRVVENYPDSPQAAFAKGVLEKSR